MKKINDFDSLKFTVKSRYSMIKYQMNLSQIDQIKGVKSFDEYLDCQKLDFQQLIEITLEQQFQEQSNQPDQANSSGGFFKGKFAGGREQGVTPMTSRLNFGGTHKMDNAGGLSSRDNSQYRNLGDYNNQNPIYTQED